MRERRDGGAPLLEGGLDAARPELPRDDEEARVDEDGREDDRREEEEVRHDEPAPDAPQEAAQEERASTLTRKTGHAKTRRTMPRAVARALAVPDRHEEDPGGRQEAAGP